MNKILVVAFFAISLFSARGVEAQNVEKKNWEIHIKLGSQTYLNELNPDPGSAALGGFLIGYNLSDRSMIGLHSASAGYQIQYTDGTTDEEWVNSFLLLYRHRFRVQNALQPYLEAGLGSADPIISYDTGSKPAVTFALGALWRFHDKLAISLESRGVSWSQDDTPDVAEFFGVVGESITVSSNEFTLGIGYLF